MIKRSAYGLLARRMLSFGVAVLTGGLLSSNAFAYDQLFWGSNRPGSGTGPLLSPEIIPVFWGDWPLGPRVGDPFEPDAVEDYLEGFAEYISGVGAPLGFEPVLKQYGVIGATVYRPEGNVFPGASVRIDESDIVAKLRSLQTQNLLVPTTSNSIFMIFLKGFSQYGFQNSTQCAFHNDSGGMRYAVVSWDGCNGGNLNQFQRLTSHELMEAMTDPIPGHGWVTHDSVIPILDLPLNTAEGGDQCQGSDATVPHPFDSSPFPFGVVQNFADNIVQACTTWTPSRNPHIAVTRVDGSQLEVFWPAQTAGVLGHATLSSSYDWTTETIDFGTSGMLIGPPAVVSASPGRMDVFVRAVFNRGSRLLHASKEADGAWVFLDDLNKGFPCDLTGCSGIGPPSAVSWAPSRIDLVVRDLDGGVLEFSSGDMNNFYGGNIGGQTIGVPSVISRGVGMLDVFTFNQNADRIENSFNGNWTNFHTFGPTAASIHRHSPMTPWTFKSGSYIEVALPEYATVNDTLAVRFQNGAWLHDPDGLSLGTAYGKVSAAVDLAGTEYDVVMESATVPVGPPANTFKATHRYDANFPPFVFLPGAPFPSQNAIDVAGVYVGPPVVFYGSDDYPEVMGIGTDGCLYENWIDWWSGAPAANGPIFTGACGLL